MAIRAQFTTPYGQAAFGSVGAAFANLLDASKDWTGGSVNGMSAIITIHSTLDQPVEIALDGSDTAAMLVRANQSRIIDLFTNNMMWSGIVRVRHAGVAPTSGTIVAEIIRGNL